MVHRLLPSHVCMYVCMHSCEVGEGEKGEEDKMKLMWKCKLGSRNKIAMIALVSSQSQTNVPFFSARVRKDDESLPLLGSVKQYDAKSYCIISEIAVRMYVFIVNDGSLMQQKIFIRSTNIHRR